MYHGYRRFVSLALSVCFILSMLFLNTLDVRAASSFSSSFTTELRPNSSSDNTFGSVTIRSGSIRDGSGSTSSGSGSVMSVQSGCATYHIKVPITVQVPWSELGSDFSNITYVSDMVNGRASYITTYAYGVNFTTSGDGTVSNLALYYSNGDLATSVNSSSVSLLGNTCRAYSISDAYGTNAIFNYIVEYDVTCPFKQMNIPTSGLGDISWVTTLNFSVTIAGRYAVPDEIENAQVSVSDSGTQNKLDSLNDSSAAIEDSVTSESGGGLLATIKSFFGSFFSNLIGIFVPEDGYFSNWFTRLNTLLADKLGMLYAPFDLLIQVLTSIMNADSSFAGIPFPGIEWDGQYLVEPFTFTFSSLGDVYTDLQGYVYFGTDVILLLAFFGLLQDKIKHILED